MKNLNKYNIAIITTVFVVLLAMSWGCDETLIVEESIDGPPVISSFEPKTGNNGTLINVEGEYLRSVDSAAFGDGEASIYRIINNNKLVLKVTNASKTGKITLKSAIGSVASAEDFNMQYPVPNSSEWPDEGVINQDVSILGENLETITKVTFQSLGSTEVYEGDVVYQKGDELAIRVPYVQADWANVESVRATITLHYVTESGEETLAGPQYAFSAKKPSFEVTSWPTAVLENTEVNIVGVNVNLADSVYFGDYPAQIVKATPISLTVLVPNVTEREFVQMRIVYFQTLEDENDVLTEVYTKYRKSLANFEGGISSMTIREDRISEGVNWELRQSSTDPLPAPEGSYYVSYFSDADPVNKSSVPLYFSYNEGEGNTINLDAFTDPVLHFYYFNDTTKAYLQLEMIISGSAMRMYLERYRTNPNDWELVCVRLNEAGFGAGYGGPYAPIDYKGTIDELHINYKPDGTSATQFHIDNVFISEGALKGAVDLTKHTAEYGFETDIVD